MRLAKVIQPVVSGAGATQTLAARDSGSLVLFDRAAGIVYTLPRPQVGLTFDFYVQTTVTSNAHKVITSSAAELLQGVLVEGTLDETPGANPGPKLFQALAGDSFVAISSNGTTTGGVIGQWYRLTCLSTTQWMVTGVIVSPNGQTIATPFATS